MYLVLCSILFFTEWSREILELCKENKDKGVVAMDLAGQEFHPGVDPDDCAHRQAFVVCIVILRFSLKRGRLTLYLEKYRNVKYSVFMLSCSEVQLCHFHFFISNLSSFILILLATIKSYKRNSGEKVDKN